MRGEHAIGQQLAELFLRPTVYDELGHEMQVGARIDVVRDASCDDAEDRPGALAAAIEPGEKPVFSSENEPAQLTFATIMPCPGLCRVRAGGAATQRRASLRGAAGVFTDAA
jgi:hypothetical protein